MSFAFLTALQIAAFNSVGLSGVSYAVMVLAASLFSAANPSALRALPKGVAVGFALLVIIGTVGFVDYPPYDAGKDVWYFTKPAIEIAFGLLVAPRVSLRGFLALIVCNGVIAALYHLGGIVWNFDEYLSLASSDIDGARARFGYGDLAVVFSLVVVLERSTRARLLRRGVGGVVIFAVVAGLDLLSMIASQSRTLAACLLLWIAIKLFQQKRRVAVLLACIVTLSVCVTLSLRVSGCDSGNKEYRDPIQELTIADYDSEEDINTNWRGFESFLALAEFSSFSPLHQLFGAGYGHMVPLDRERQLGENSFDEIPVLHNGYLYVLVKVGICGLAVFVAILVMMGREVLRRRYVVDQGIQIIHLWTVLVVAFTTYVVMGAFNVSELRLILIGYGYLLGVSSRSQDPDIAPARISAIEVPAR